MCDPNESEDEPEKHQYTEEEFKNREVLAKISVQQNMTDHLLMNAKLFDEEPFTKVIDNFEPSDGLISCETADKSFARLNKSYPIQKKVWPYISNGCSTILVGDTEFYPHLLYLPIVCGQIEVIF